MPLLLTPVTTGQSYDIPKLSLCSQCVYYINTNYLSCSLNESDVLQI